MRNYGALKQSLVIAIIHGQIRYMEKTVEFIIELKKDGAALYAARKNKDDMDHFEAGEMSISL